jgi:small-conductance mechanosensitive channel
MRSLRFLLLLIVLALGVVTGAAAGAGLAFAGPIDGLEPAPNLDRGSPRRAFEGFLRAGDRGNFTQAAHYLDLRGIPAGRQAAEGPLAAEKLHYVLTHIGRFTLAKIPDDPETTIPKGDSTLEVGTFDVPDGPVPIGMNRVRFGDGVDRWIFGKSTVAIAPTIDSTLPRPSFGDRLPAWLRVTGFGNQLWQWLALLALFPVAYPFARILALVLVRLLAFFARRTPTSIDDHLVTTLKQPLHVLFTALLVDAVAPILHLTTNVAAVLAHVTFTLIVFSSAWAAARAVSTVATGLVATLPSTPEGEIAQRRLKTRLAIFQRLAIVFVILLAVALALLQFESVRAIGVSLLASAGLAGVVLGFAAQRSLGAVVSGIQLSVTQPIRIGDAVVIEGEYGTVEAIHLTQVIIALWDERRLVVPVSRFLDQPFQNWSKAKDKLLGTVLVTCDFTTPVARVREELRRITAASSQWDKRDCGLQVTDMSERSMTLRAIVSARTPGALFDLRCEIRERLVAFLQSLDDGRSLPRSRYDRVQPAASGGASDA